jgi:hypothetical protein
MVDNGVDIQHKNGLQYAPWRGSFLKELHTRLRFDFLTPVRNLFRNGNRRSVKVLNPREIVSNLGGEIVPVGKYATA